MRYLALLICLFCCVTAHAVVDGRRVSDAGFASDYPWMVAVVNNNQKGNCGGILIAPTWVLTAAHCTGIKKHVLVGSSAPRNARRIEIINAYRHPGFSASSLQNDIGVLQLAEAVDLPLAPVANEVESRLLLLPGQKGFILGWGHTEKGRGMAPRLMQSRIESDNLRVMGSQVAIDFKGGGPCTRDSGGPLVLTTLAGAHRVVAIISATDGNLCSSNGGLAIYTNIGAVTDFIERFVELPASE